MQQVEPRCTPHASPIFFCVKSLYALCKQPEQFKTDWKIINTMFICANSSIYTIFQETVFRFRWDKFKSNIAKQ